MSETSAPPGSHDTCASHNLCQRGESSREKIGKRAPRTAASGPCCAAPASAQARDSWRHGTAQRCRSYGPASRPSTSDPGPEINSAPLSTLKWTNMNRDRATEPLGFLTPARVSGTAKGVWAARGGSHESLGVLELLRCVLVLRAHLLRLRPATHRPLIPRAHHHLRRPHSLLLLRSVVQVQAVDGVLADLLDEVSGVGLQHFGLEHFDGPAAR